MEFVNVQKVIMRMRRENVNNVLNIVKNVKTSNNAFSVTIFKILFYNKEFVFVNKGINFTRIQKVKHSALNNLK